MLCIPQRPAYLQQRGSRGNPGTHQNFLPTILSWRNSLLPSPPPREMTIKLKSTSNSHKLFSIFLSLLSTPAPLPQSSVTADDFVVFFDGKIADTHSSFTTTPPTRLLLSAPCLSSFSPLTDTNVSQLLSHHPTTCALDPIPSSLLQAIAPDILPFVTSLVNSSLSSGSSSFKKAYITTLLNKPTPLYRTTVQYFSFHLFIKHLNQLLLANSFLFTE